jgi:hypothetical protein
MISTDRRRCPARKFSGGIDVTVLYRITVPTKSRFYSQISLPFWTSALLAAATGLCGMHIINFLKPYAGVTAFELQHGPECTRARVQNRFGLGRFRKG